MSFRSLIAPLLILGLLGACDRQVSRQEQAAATPTPAPAAAPAPLPAGAIDRSHKGEAAPATPFRDAAGEPTTLAAFRGKPVLLNLWATWCGPCVKEMPGLDTLAATMPVVAVSQDLGDKGRKDAATFLLQKGLSNLHLYTDSEATLSTRANVALPTTILYDAEGREVWRTTGGTEWTAPRAKALLAQAG